MRGRGERGEGGEHIFFVGFFPKKYSQKTNQFYVFLIAVIRQNGYVHVIPLSNKKFDTLFAALEKLKKTKEFSHINTLLSDQESAFHSGKPIKNYELVLDVK